MAASPTTAATDQPAIGLLIYDGECGFCTSSARWYAKRSGDRVSIAPWQSLDLGAYGLTEAEVTTAAYWVEGNHVRRGADGIAEALRACEGFWRFAGVVLANPPGLWIARLIYPVVARIRHRLPGSTATCRLDDPHS